jgi:thiazole synthase
MKNNIDTLTIGNKVFNSRLMLGTGKYKTPQDANDSIQASECEIITVAIRRLPTNLKNDNSSFLTNLDWDKLWLYQILPVRKLRTKQLEWHF